ncbi:hypothetical protein BC939DRAFT_516743 [Gamsiella multidivaricata]|uniref:uncharacterized protein n=1 Tax=Gamsiella multidivaricata TaxID=101098 RepID=UPI0022209A2F|nr:uncharacterized protein BC939DRAFT_516743 [Gamsiella multidivaricata]KAI7823268.1 hypothetical protein BC939DRAFT_516743 [Gamsiella multidivaricata]
MEWEHPTVTLDVGTVAANLQRALGESELVPVSNPGLSATKDGSEELDEDAAVDDDGGEYDDHDNEKAMAKGLVAKGTRTEVELSLQAVENFMFLNHSSQSYRKTAPFTGPEKSFMSFFERELCILFWQNIILQTYLRELIREDFPSTNTPLSQSDVILRLQSKPAGTIISKLLSNVGRAGPRKGSRSFKDSTSMIDLATMREYIQSIRQANSDPRNYTERGYVLRGSIHTDGFHLQLPAFKMKELYSVKYREYPTLLIDLHT